jgi:hypothetical protein
MNFLLRFLTWLDMLPWVYSYRESELTFAMIETTHILALGFSVGIIMWLDLRLLGLTLRKQRVADVIRQFEPWAIGGFIVMVISGALLFLEEPLKCYYSTAFRIKLVMLILAGLNVLYFNWKVLRNVHEWDQVVPWKAKAVAWVSLVLWAGVIVAGRWTAY